MVNGFGMMKLFGGEFRVGGGRLLENWEPVKDIAKFQTPTPEKVSIIKQSSIQISLLTIFRIQENWCVNNYLKVQWKS